MAKLCHSILPFACPTLSLSLSLLPLKLLMWQIHKIKIKWKVKRRVEEPEGRRKRTKSSHNEHFPLPYLCYFIIIFLRRSLSHKMAARGGIFFFLFKELIFTVSLWEYRNFPLLRRPFKKYRFYSSKIAFFIISWIESF